MSPDFSVALYVERDTNLSDLEDAITRMDAFLGCPPSVLAMRKSTLTNLLSEIGNIVRSQANIADDSNRKMNNAIFGIRVETVDG